MPHYKDAQNKLYWLDSIEHEFYLPAGSLQITDAEATSIRTAEQVALTYAQKRVEEYPPIGDQLDALWKGGDAQTEMRAKVMAVKAKYPKDAA